MIKLLLLMTIIASFYQSTESKPRKLLADKLEMKTHPKGIDTLCDLCDQNIPKGEPHMQCREFDFDLCKAHSKLKPTVEQMKQMQKLEKELRELVDVKMLGDDDPNVKDVKKKMEELQEEIKSGKPGSKSAAKSVNVSMIAAFVVIVFLMN